jgi:hypothetical protein
MGGEPAEERGGEGKVAMAPLLLVAMRATLTSLAEASIGIGSYDGLGEGRTEEGDEVWGPRQ